MGGACIIRHQEFIRGELLIETAHIMGGLALLDKRHSFESGRAIIKSLTVTVCSITCNFSIYPHSK